MAIACSTSIRCGSSLEAALADIQKSGIRKVDILTIGSWAHVNVKEMAADIQGTLARVDALVKRHGLTPIAMNTGTSVQLHDRSDEANAQRRKEIAAFVAMMKKYQIKVAAIQPLAKDPKRPGDQVLRDCVATLREQIGMAREAGVDFALELHVNSPFETMEQAQALLREMPDVPLVYDPTHFVMQGLDIRQTAGLMDNARHSHLRDAAKGKLQAPFGQGQVDFDWLLNTLKDRGYKGNFSIEYLESKDFDVLDSVKRLYDKIRSVFPA